MDNVKINEALPKNHPHYNMRNHHAWQDVKFPCKGCGHIIKETESGKCSKCTTVKHKPLKRLNKKK